MSVNTEGTTEFVISNSLDSHRDISSRERFSSVRRVFRNYVSVWTHILLRRFPCEGKLWDGRIFQLTDTTQALAAAAYESVGWRFDDGSDSVVLPSTMGGFVFRGAGHNGDLLGIFSQGEYGSLNVEGRTVLDIGCNIGDSLVYFASRGAHRVVGLEPFPIPYQLAADNVSANGLSERIAVLRAACADKDGETFVDPNLRDTAISIVGDGTPTLATPSLSLDTLVKNYQIQGGVLKVDCEGGEYGIFESATPTALRSFSQVLVEYHYGIGNLARSLVSAGFTVVGSRPRHLSAGHGRSRTMDVGLIVAERKTAHSRTVSAGQVEALHRDPSTFEAQ